MPKRKQTTIFVPAILVLLSTAVFLKARTSFAQSVQSVAADCITSPGSAPPQGSHWYFRVDRMLHRRCWYLGPEGARLQASAPRAELPMRLPPPRPPSLSIESLPATDNAGTVSSRMTNNESDIDSSSILRWRRVISSTMTNEPGFESNNVAIGNTGAEEQMTTSAQDDMPLVWPALTSADVATIDLRIISPERMLMMLAGAFACAMMVGLIVRRAGADLVARASPPDRRRSTTTLRRLVEQNPAARIERPAAATLLSFIPNSNSETSYLRTAASRRLGPRGDIPVPSRRAPDDADAIRSARRIG
jgi:hypothetical protein